MWEVFVILPLTVIFFFWITNIITIFILILNGMFCCYIILNLFISIFNNKYNDIIQQCNSTQFNNNKLLKSNNNNKLLN
jgi:hypothetical protein